MEALSIVIRRATPADADAAARVFTESRRSAGAALPPSVHSAEEDAWFVREILIGERETWVAVVHGELAGILTLDKTDLDQLYVSGSFTRKGIGSRLVELAKRERPKGLELWCFESNLPARGFYEKHGFVAIERTDGAANENRAPDIRFRWSP